MQQSHLASHKSVIFESHYFFLLAYFILSKRHDSINIPKQRQNSTPSAQVKLVCSAADGISQISIRFRLLCTFRP